ncbi:hypothetical protein DFH09DRAFT_1329476 [Mycena vulgaris]|nr:hypothetical protein DFH09DRAFT_1329476 [Mycena vulgaris]
MAPSGQNTEYHLSFPSPPKPPPPSHPPPSPPPLTAFLLWCSFRVCFPCVYIDGPAGIRRARLISGSGSVRARGQVGRGGGSSRWLLPLLRTLPRARTRSAELELAEEQLKEEWEKDLEEKKKGRSRRKAHSNASCGRRDLQAELRVAGGEGCAAFDGWRGADAGCTEPELANALTYQYASAAQLEFMKNYPSMAAELRNMAQSMA